MKEIVFNDVAKAKQAKRDAAIPKEWLATDAQIAAAKDKAGGRTDWPALVPEIVLSGEHRAMTEAGASEILAKIHGKQWTARQVTEAFCRRAALAQQLTNCLTEIFFDKALTRAEELDDHLAQHGKPAGPLAGLPISIKDNFYVKGYDTTVGFLAWTNDPAQHNSPLVDILLQQGAVLYCKTNIPTAMMIAETVNNVWGRTSNPYSLDCSPGGSSGGEGALSAMRGSPVGVGTDIGGSVRIPSALSGIYGLKPSLGRIPTMGARSGMAGQEAVSSITGPMSADLEALTLFTKAVVDAQPWRIDPKCVPMPWKQPSELDLPAQGLVFGVLLNDGLISAAPPIVRALKTTAKALEAAGHHVVFLDPKPFEFMQGFRILIDFFRADGGGGILDLMTKGGEAEQWVPGLGRPTESKTVNQTWAIQAERWEWGANVFKQWEQVRGPNGRVMDAILCPATPSPGVQHDNFGPYVGFTGVWNVLDVSAGVLPITRIDAKRHPEDQDTPEPADGFLSDFDRDVWRRFDAGKSHGMPVNIQVVGHKLQEEKVLGLMKRIDEISGSSKQTLKL